LSTARRGRFDVSLHALGFSILPPANFTLRVEFAL